MPTAYPYDKCVNCLWESFPGKVIPGGFTPGPRVLPACSKELPLLFQNDNNIYLQISCESVKKRRV